MKLLGIRFLFLILMGFIGFNPSALGMDHFSCKRCSYEQCKRCLNLSLEKENKEKEIARLESIIKKNQEVMQKNRSASALIKINSNILLGSLNKEALKTELEGILNRYRGCQQCQ